MIAPGDDCAKVDCPAAIVVGDCSGGGGGDCPVTNLGRTWFLEFNICALILCLITLAPERFSPWQSLIHAYVILLHLIYFFVIDVFFLINLISM